MSERPNLKISQYLVDEFNQLKHTPVKKQQSLINTNYNNDDTFSQLLLLFGGSILGTVYLMGMYKMMERE
jgi:hypothetical protein